MCITEHFCAADGAPQPPERCYDYAELPTNISDKETIVMAILVSGGAGYIGSHTCVEPTKNRQSRTMVMESVV